MRLTFIIMIVLSIMSCGEDNTMNPDDGDPGGDGSGMDTTENPIINDVVDSWTTVIKFRTCSSLQLDLEFDITGDTLGFEYMGLIIEDQDSEFRDSIVRPYEPIPEPFGPVYSVYVYDLDPAHHYHITPFIIVNGGTFYHDMIVHSIQNFTEIDMQFLGYTNDLNLINDYITEATALKIDSKGYLIGGRDGSIAENTNATHYDTFYEIDFDDMSVRVLAPLPRPAASMISFIWNGQIYAGAGILGQEELFTDIYRYNRDQDVWIYVTDYPHPNGLAGGTAIVLGDYVYMGLGVESFALATGSRLWYRYDPDENTWEKLKDHPLGSSGGAHFSIGQHIYATHGAGSWSFSYDTQSDTWHSLFGGGLLQDAVAFARDGIGYAYSGGWNQSGTSVHTYDPIVEEWQEKCIALPEYRTYEGVVFDDGVSDPIVGFGTNNTIYRLNVQ